MEKFKDVKEWLEQNHMRVIIKQKWDPRETERYKRCEESGKCCHKGWSNCYSGLRNHPYFKSN